MDHKEYSSGGSEFFPTGQEFSSAQQEIQRPPPEIIPAAPEVSQSGSEFHQSAGPEQKAEKKRRRSISPAMLTTAAVVTAAVIISPLSSHLTGNQNSASSYPNLELSAQSKAYLDEVWEALPLGDAEQLIALAEDDRLRALAVNEAMPYIEQLEQKYDFDHHEYCDFCNDSGEYTLLEGFHHYNLYYDGQTAGPSRFGRDNIRLYFLYERYAHKEQPDYIYSNAHFNRMDFASNGDTANGYWAYISSHEDVNGYEYNFVDYEAGQYQLMEIANHRYYNLDSGYTYSKNWQCDTGSDRSEFYYHEEVSEGDFAYAELKPDDPSYTMEIRTYLNNGTITIKRDGSDYQNGPFVYQIQVVDGVIQRTDDMIIKYHESVGQYELLVEYYDEAADTQRQTSLYASSEIASEEDLFHSINWFFSYSSSFFID